MNPVPSPRSAASSTPAAAPRPQPTSIGPGGIRVEADALHDDAAAVQAFADRVTATAAHVVRIDSAPRWATTSAAAPATATARRLLSTLGNDMAETAQQIRAVVTDYEEADARAAARLRAAR